VKSAEVSLSRRNNQVRLVQKWLEPARHERLEYKIRFMICRKSTKYLWWVCQNDWRTREFKGSIYYYMETYGAVWNSVSV